MIATRYLLVNSLLPHINSFKTKTTKSINLLKILSHHRVVRGQGGHVLSEIPMLKIFLSKQYRICDIQSNVQHVFQVYGDFAPKPHPGLPCWERNPLFCLPRKQIPGYAPVSHTSWEANHIGLFIQNIVQSFVLNLVMDLLSIALQGNHTLRKRYVKFIDINSHSRYFHSF